MFLGHYGLAFALKRWTGRVSLGVLVLASQWADLVWPVLVLAGIERVAIEPGITAFTPLDFVHYPWSHSLLMGVVWGIAIGVVYYTWTRRSRDAVLVGALVPSHWILDLFVHRPDLPIWPGGPKLGFGLWNSLIGTLLVEFGIFIIGIGIYLTATTARGRIGSWGVAGLGALLVVGYLGASFGTEPPDGMTVALSALALVLVVPIAHWVDAHRESTER